MIINKIFEWFIHFFDTILNILPTLPNLPTDITNTIDSIYNFIFSSLQLVNLFLPLNLCITLCELVFGIVVFKFTWGVIDFIARHIPVLGTH